MNSGDILNIAAKLLYCEDYDDVEQDCEIDEYERMMGTYKILESEVKSINEKLSKDNENPTMYMQRAEYNWEILNLFEYDNFGVTREKILSDISIAIRLDPQNVSYIIKSGEYAFPDLYELEDKKISKELIPKSLNSYLYALKIEPSNISAIIGIGKCYYELEAYDDYLKLLKSIKQDDIKNGEVFYWQGLCTIRLGNYETGIKLLMKAIILWKEEELFKQGMHFDLTNAIFELGYAYMESGNFDEALVYLESHVLGEFRMYEEKVYFFIGICYQKTEKYWDAINSYNTSIYRNYKYRESIKKISECIELIDKNGKYGEFSKDIDLMIIEYAHKVFPCMDWSEESDVFKLFEELRFLQQYTKKILETNVHKFENKCVYHYTTIESIPKIFVPVKINSNISTDKGTSAKFRISNSIHMNDPGEGKVFAKLLEEYNECGEIQRLNCIMNKLFNASNHMKDNSTFIMSFSAVDHYDILPMWVHYSDNATGCAIRLDKEFFAPSWLKKKSYYDDSEFLESLLDENAHTLYNVSYIDLESFKCDTEHKEISNVRKYFSEISKRLINIHKIINHEHTDELTYKQEVYNVIKMILNQVRYLYKEKSYAYENEVRIIRYQKDDIKVYENNDINTNVPKLYVDLEQELDYSKMGVILGPKVQRKSEVAAYLYHVGVDEVIDSKIKYQ